MGTNDHGNLDPRVVAIAKQLKALRLQRGYRSYEAFALDHDLDRKQYWRMEKGTNFTILSLLKVLDVYELSLQDFFASLTPASH